MRIVLKEDIVAHSLEPYHNNDDYFPINRQYTDQAHPVAGKLLPEYVQCLYYTAKDSTKFLDGIAYPTLSVFSFSPSLDWAYQTDMLHPERPLARYASTGERSVVASVPCGTSPLSPFMYRPVAEMRQSLLASEKVQAAMLQVASEKGVSSQEINQRAHDIIDKLCGVSRRGRHEIPKLYPDPKL